VSLSPTALSEFLPNGKIENCRFRAWAVNWPKTIKKLSNRELFWEVHSDTIINSSLISNNKTSIAEYVHLFFMSSDKW